MVGNDGKWLRDLTDFSKVREITSHLYFLFPCKRRFMLGYSPSHITNDDTRKNGSSQNSHSTTSYDSHNHPHFT